MSTTSYPRPMTTPTQAPAAPPKPAPGKGAKIAAAVIFAVVAIACLIGGIAIAHSSGSKLDTATLSQVAVTKCENAIKAKVTGGTSFSKESYNKTKDPTWALVGDVSAGGRDGLYTCDLTRHGDSFTVTASDVVFE